MGRFRIGVIADSFGLPLLQGIEKAASLGAEGIQIWAVDGDLAPENIDFRARKDFQRYCHDRNLVIAALCGDLGGHGFQIREEAQRNIPRSKLIIDLAVDLCAPVVTTHIGMVPDDRENPVYGFMVDSCRDIGVYAHNRGISFAIETGPEPAQRLLRFLEDVDTPGMAVNFDPANLVMVLGEDPVTGVKLLADRIVHTHAKDGVRYKPCDPIQVYEAFAVGGLEALNFGDFFDEVPLGTGQVDWDAYLAALNEINYSGFLTIEREVGDDPESDIRSAIDFLKKRI